MAIIVFTLFLVFLAAFQFASASSITQGEYAILLAGKLGLGKNLSADAAIAALTKVEIMPANGFKPGDPMNPVVADEILSAARKACKKGLLSLTCKEVDTIVTSLNKELELIPPEPPTLPPPPPRDPASPAS